MATMNAYRVTVFGAHGNAGSIYAGFFAAADKVKAAERARFYYAAASDAECLVELVEEACNDSHAGEAA